MLHWLHPCSHSRTQTRAYAMAGEDSSKRARDRVSVSDDSAEVNKLRRGHRAHAKTTARILVHVLRVTQICGWGRD
jgi:hypothetical protein